MPYHIAKKGSGYVVKTTATGKSHSKKPMTHAKAVKQMRAMYASEKPK